jgi:hypothetical protein
MYIVIKERALAQARALSGTLALAEQAGWTFDHKAPLMLRAPFSHYLHVAATDLLLVPSIKPTRRDLAIVHRGMREACRDALVVKASSEGRRTLYIAYGQWGRQENVWCHGRRLWLSPHGKAWLVPDPHDSDNPHLSMRLPSRVRGPVRGHPGRDRRPLRGSPARRRRGRRTPAPTSSRGRARPAAGSRRRLCRGSLPGAGRRRGARTGVRRGGLSGVDPRRPRQRVHLPRPGSVGVHPRRHARLQPGRQIAAIARSTSAG